MKIAFVLNGSKKSYDHALAEAVGDGAPGPYRVLDEYRHGFDLYCIIGVKNRTTLKRLRRDGRRFLYFDKAYNRDWPDWWRVCVDAHQPTRYLPKLAFHDDRMRAQGWTFKPWRTEGTHIVLAGSSAKYHDLYDLPGPTEFAQGVVRQIAVHSPRAVFYRTKPSWKDAVDVAGAHSIFHANYDIREDLKNAHALITHGSNACFEAMLEGVPCVVLGEAVVRPISSVRLTDIEAPRLASDEDRRQLLANLAYCQWSLSEIRSGKIWTALTSIIQAST